MYGKSILLGTFLLCSVSGETQLKLPELRTPKSPKTSRDLITEAPVVTNTNPYKSISTIAGSGLQFQQPDSYGEKDGNGREARFYNPFDIIIDDHGNFFIADFMNYRIRKMTGAGMVSTFAGSNQGQEDGSLAEGRLYSPVAICFDKNGDLIVADKNYNAIRKITKTGMTTIAGGNGNGYEDGEATTAQFNRPVSVVVNSKGDIFVCDEGNHRIRKISGNKVSTYAGNGNGGYQDGPAAEADFLYPKNIAIDAEDNIYVAEITTVRKITTAGIVTTVAGKNGVQGRRDGNSSNATFSSLTDIAIGASGTIYVVDAGSTDALSDNHEINLKYRNGGAAIRMISPSGMVQTVAGSYICSQCPDTETSQGQFILTDGPVNRAFLSFDVFGICLDKEENIYVTDAGFNCIRKVLK